MPIFLLITAGLILIGAILMALSLRATLHLLTLVKNSEYSWRWRVLAGLMAFFLLGYLAAIALVLGESRQILVGLTGVIFLFGALFVLLIVRMSRLTIRELVAAGEQLATARDQALAAVTLRQELMARMTHELRTPLHAIIGYTDMVKSGVFGPLNEKQDELVGRMATNSDRLLQMINSILHQAQIESGEIDLQKTLFVPADLLAHVEQIIAPLAEKKGLALAVDIDPDLPGKIAGDSVRLQEIIVNLAGNAVKFTDQGMVRIQLGLVDQQTWMIKVSDSGPGIPEDKRDFIFEPFHQLDGSITRQFGGSGLGLSIVKQLVALMEGITRVESQTGQGSHFIVELPLIRLPEEVHG